MTTAATTERGLELEAHRAEEGCVAYLLWDRAGRDGLAIDPRLDQVEALLGTARARGVRIRSVIDTHTHADHLSGARRLAARAGAELLAPEGSRIGAPARRVASGSTFALGAIEVRVLPAPGHTPDAAALLADGHLFTGDALFLEGVGRTDFPGGSPDDLLDTLERFERLPGSTTVHPGHDYRGLGEASLEDLRARHPVLSVHDRAVRRERVAGRGAVIPDIRRFLAWNLAQADPEELPVLAVRDLVRGGGAVLVDVRTPAEFGQMRIDGSITVPLPDLATRADTLPTDREIVLVCRTGLRARQAREILAGRGIRAAVMEGGLESWRAAALPLPGARSGVLPIDRQVQWIVGSGVLAGVLLGAFVSPWALILPGFFGAGLVFAGATGTCGLARILSVLPWNRPANAPPASACSAGGGPPPPSCSAGSAPAGG